MKKIILCAICAICGFTTANAQKFGHVNSQEIIQAMPEFAKARTEIEALTKQYEALLAMDNVVLEFQPKALEAVAKKAVDRQIGARGLRAVMEETMTKIMYVIPSDLSIRKVVITPEAIDGKEPKILRDKTNPRQKLIAGE